MNLSKARLKEKWYQRPQRGSIYTDQFSCDLGSDIRASERFSLNIWSRKLSSSNSWYLIANDESAFSSPLAKLLVVIDSLEYNNEIRCVYNDNKFQIITWVYRGQGRHCALAFKASLFKVFRICLLSYFLLVTMLGHLIIVPNTSPTPHITHCFPSPDTSPTVAIRWFICCDCDAWEAWTSWFIFNIRQICWFCIYKWEFLKEKSWCEVH